MSEEPKLLPEIAAHNLNQLKWIAVPYTDKDAPYTDKDAIEDDKETGQHPQPCGEFKDGTVSKGHGYYLRGILPTTKGELGDRKDERRLAEEMVETMKVSLTSLGIETKGVTGFHFEKNKKFPSAEPGYLFVNTQGTLDVYGVETINKLYASKVDVPIPDNLKKELRPLTAVDLARKNNQI